jgi:peptidoglycan/LPS O-acetylase OafA/YrhL
MYPTIKKIFSIEIDTRRIFGLDVLRSIAILFVLVEHSCNYLPSWISKKVNYFLLDGVSIFFVLSGFLIGGILIKTIQQQGNLLLALRTFWIRRWWRTIPPYLIVLSSIFLLHIQFDPKFDWQIVGGYFIFSQNIFTIHPKFFGEAWSLSIEEWFYLLIPMMFVLGIAISKKSKHSMLWVCIIVIIVELIFRYYKFNTTIVTSNYDWDVLFRKQVSTRLDSLVFGVIGAYISHYYHHKWVKFKNQLLVIGMLLLVIVKYISIKYVADNSLYNCVFSFSVTSIAILCTLPYLSQMQKSTGRMYRIITRISLISYAMYLLNLTIIQQWMINPICWKKININADVLMWLKLSIYWGLTILLSILFYKYIEQPIIAYRNRSRK